MSMIVKQIKSLSEANSVEGGKGVIPYVCNGTLCPAGIPDSHILCADESILLPTVLDKLPSRVPWYTALVRGKRSASCW